MARKEGFCSQQTASKTAATHVLNYNRQLNPCLFRTRQKGSFLSRDKESIDMAIRQICCTVSLAALCMALSSPARAITAGDVMNEMSSEQRTGFFTGAIDMASHLFAVGGNREKAECAVNWFFGREGSLGSVHSFFEEHQDKDAVGLLHVLINRECGN